MGKQQFSKLKVGQQIKPVSRKITLVQNVMYAAATWDFFRLHYDIEYARKIGLAGPICDGQMLGSLLARMIMGWADEEIYQLKRIRLSYRKMVYIGDILKFGGKVKSKSIEDGQRQIVLELSVTNQNGEKVISDGEAILISGNHENGDKQTRWSFE